MKIVVLTNLYPPHSGGKHDYRCQAVVENLRLRGHQIRVLTSTFGLSAPQRDDDVERTLLLNGFYNAPPITRYPELRQIELRNHQALSQALSVFQPDIVHAFSLRGLSKSFIFALGRAGVPVVYDVADGWLSLDLRQDPWLRWWNQPRGSFSRTWREWVGQRHRLDAQAPTRPARGLDRITQLYDDDVTAPPLAPNSIQAFRFDHIYFCSRTLRQLAVQAGFGVNHAEIIYPAVPTQNFVGDVKPPGAPTEKLLVVSRLNPKSGVMTALKAVQAARANQVKISLSVYGRGDSSYLAELRSFAALQRLPVDFKASISLRRELPNIYRQHDALLHTAQEAEPFSFSPLEAMASGLPVIGTALGGTGELLRHGENALTFAAGDDQQLAARIQELVDQPALRHQLAERAQHEVLTQFNETAVTDRIEQVLETALRSAAQASPG